MKMNVGELTSCIREWLLTASPVSRLALADHFEALGDEEASGTLRDGRLHLYVAASDRYVIRGAAEDGADPEDLISVHAFYCRDARDAFCFLLGDDEDGFDTYEEALEHVRSFDVAWGGVDDEEEEDPLDLGPADDADDDDEEEDGPPGQEA